jgi:CHAD domain-containing protein
LRCCSRSVSICGPAARSKAERGYALARGEGAAAHLGRRVRLDPGATLEDALVAILSHCLAHFTANADCAHEGTNPEGIHQMRVGVRRAPRPRWRCSARCSRPSECASSAPSCAGSRASSAAARDLDVFERGLLARLDTPRAGYSALERLRAEAALLRAECYDGVRACLDSGAMRGSCSSSAAGSVRAGWQEHVSGDESLRWLDPARGFADAELERRHRKVGRLARRLHESDAARHAVRIELKKLRYAGEFLRDLYPGRGAKRFLRRIARVQSALGHMNDVATAERILATLLARLGAERTREHDAPRATRRAGPHRPPRTRSARRPRPGTASSAPTRSGSSAFARSSRNRPGFLTATARARSTRSSPHEFRDHAASSPWPRFVLAAAAALSRVGLAVQRRAAKASDRSWIALARARPREVRGDRHGRRVRRVAVDADPTPRVGRSLRLGRGRDSSHPRDDPFSSSAEITHSRELRSVLRVATKLRNRL